MKKYYVWILIGIIVVLGLVLVYLVKSNRLASTAAGPVASLTLTPSSGTYTVGSTFDVAINLNTGGAYVDGVDIVRLHFPTTSLRATAVRAGSITAMSLSPSPVTPDNTAGTITFVSYVAGGSNGYTGAGSIAIVTFQVLAASSSAAITFDFNAAAPSTTDCNVAEHSTGSDILGSVTNASFVTQNVNTINTILKLQGRTNHSTSGAIFTIYNAGTSTVAYSKSDLATDTNGNATFTVNGLGNGPYDIKVKAPYHISYKLTNKTMTNPITLDFGTLKAGDLDNNDTVNSLDFSILNGKWLLSDAIADIDANGIVNTLDFSFMNSNWLVTGL